MFHFLLEDISSEEVTKRLTKIHCPDGRINSDFITLLRAVKKGIPTFFFDNVSMEDYDTYPNENIRDKVMADEIKSHLHANVKTLIWAGNYHTDLSRTDIADMSMVAYLQKYNIPFTPLTFTYGAGSFYNFGKKNLSYKRQYDSYTLSQKDGSYELTIPHPQAATIY